MMAAEATREGGLDSEHAGFDDLAGVAPPKPADLSSEAGHDTVREPAAELSALNAPAEVSLLACALFCSFLRAGSLAATTRRVPG